MTPTKKILLVDDDEPSRTLFAGKFTEAGFEVITAEDGLAGLNLATVQKPDLVFSGIMMPHMDGFDLLKNLRANVQTSDVPVIIFSHLGREEDRKTALDLGANAFIVKGFTTPNDVVKIIQNLFEGRSFRVAITSDRYDAPKLRERLNYKTDLILELTQDPNDPSLFQAKAIQE